MKKVLKKFLFLNIAAAFTVGSTYAQNGSKDYNPIPTGVPSLTITPDARGGGMGDAGVATSPDIYSQYWNPAKYAFATGQAGAAMGYTPWLKKIVNDVYLAYGVGYYKLGSNDNQALSASIRYFKIGDIQLANAWGYTGTNISPYEMSFDIGYSRKLTNTFSAGVTLRYIRVDYSGADDDTSADGVFAADISGYNESYINIGQSESLLSFGFNISNIGGKISNNDGITSNFIPTNLRLGTSLMYPINDVSTISASLDFNKLLVPTPPIQGDDESNEDYEKRLNDYRDISSISGIFKSFATKDGGFSEKMKEISVSFGLEYDYNDQFKVRTGYFHENKMKGNRRYFTFGAGFKMKSIQLDAAYLLSTVSQNPLDQTLRLTLAYTFPKSSK